MQERIPHVPFEFSRLLLLNFVERSLSLLQLQLSEH